jgi:hypothetical protein
MSEFGIIHVVVSAMHDLETVKHLRGEEKKDFVLQKVQKIIGDEKYSQYEDFLPILIDFVIALSKNEYLLQLNIPKTIKTKIQTCLSCMK